MASPHSGAHSYDEIARSFDLWQEYVDPDGTTGREEFDAMSHADRVSLQREAFGPEPEPISTVADLLEQTAISSGLHRWAIEGGSIEVPADELRTVLAEAYDDTNPNWVATIAYDDSIGFWVA